MSFFQLGSIIRNRREELGYSQEDLADGICSVPTLSRIENGERMPTKNHYEMLMQRLGYSAISLDFFTDKKDFLIHELKFKIRHAYIENDFPRCRKLLQELCAVLDERNPIDEQFVCLYDTLLNQKSLDVTEKLTRLETALRLTCRRYGKDFIPKILSYEEIILLNNIAVCFDSLGQRDRTIELLYAIKGYYERPICSSEEALRTQPMILYNLSKVLGQEGRFDECIAVCNQGISLAHRTYRYAHYEKLLYNHAWAHLRRNHAGDRAIAKQSIKLAYGYTYSLGNQKMMEMLRKYFEEVFSEGLSI